MKKITSCWLGATLLLAGINLAAAQENQEGVVPPPKVLTIFREFLKPGKGGGAHEKAESAFVQAMTQAKWPTHYFAVNSLSGKSRALFLTPYDSFEAWEKDSLAVQKNATLAAALDRAAVNDGELLSETDSTVLVYNEDQSLRGPVAIAHMRYFEISLYKVKAGHRNEWAELVKLVKAAYEKLPDSHWAMYEAVYGQEGATYAVFVPLKSASEIDRNFAQDKDFAAAMGEDGMKKLGELEASAIEFSQTNLFQFSPKMSYPPDAWVKADPDFWKAKAAAAPKAKAASEEKPAAKP
jgi:hypothetical protein